MVDELVLSTVHDVEASRATLNGRNISGMTEYTYNTDFMKPPQANLIANRTEITRTGFLGQPVVILSNTSDQTTNMPFDGWN